MTDQTNTPPTVGQPPVAEGWPFGYDDEMHALLDRFWHAAAKGDWDGFVEMDIRRLTQARSAPPSDMVLVSRTTAKFAQMLLKDEMMSAGGRRVYDAAVDAAYNDIVTALTAPSGGPDVE